MAAVIKICALGCAMHAKASYMLEHKNLDGLRANLMTIRKLGPTVWRGRCRCNLWERVEEAIKHGSQ